MVGPAAVARALLLAGTLTTAALAPALAAEVAKVPPGLRIPPTDIVLARDGTLVRGKLQSCVADVCHLGSQSFSREATAWIGLGVETATPPAVVDSAEDEVRLRDGGVHSGHLVGVSLGEVVTEKGSYDRPAVAWIHFAGAAEPKSPPVVGQEKPQPREPPPVRPPKPTETGGGGAAPQSPGGSPRAPRPPHAPGDLVKPCPASKPLGGLYEIDWSPRDSACTVTIHATLRFPLVPSALPSTRWPVTLWTAQKAPSTAYEIRVSNCIDVPGDSDTCTGPPEQTHGTVTLGSMGPLGFKEEGTGYISFEAMKPSIYLLMPDVIHEAVEQPITCSNGQSTWVMTRARRGFAGANVCATSCGGDDPFIAPVAPAECASRGDAECTQHEDRYAVIPFEGDYLWGAKSSRSPFLRSRMRWQICCGCGETPKAPPSLGDNDRCGSTAASDGFVERNREERAKKVKELAEKWKEYQRALDEAKGHRKAFEDLVRLCNVQDLVTKLLIAALGGEMGEGPEALGAAPKVGHAAGEAAEELAEELPKVYAAIAEVVEKIEHGEDPTVALGPEKIQNFVKAEHALEQFLDWLNGASAERLGEKLEECMGTIGTSYDQYKSAEAYVDAIKEATRAADESAQLVNEISQLDNQLPDLQYRAWADCVQRARCLGAPDSSCDGKKPQCNWPPVP